MYFIGMNLDSLITRARNAVRNNNDGRRFSLAR